MAITNKEEGVWGIEQVYNKINQGSIWDYDGTGGAFVWGINNMGELGLNQPSQSYHSSPVQLPGNWGTIKGGSSVTHGVKSDGTLWAWGRNDQGRLGVNQPTSSKYSSPVQIPGTTWSTDRKKLSNNGGIGGAAIKTSGELWMWGQNNKGQLGQNNTDDTLSPVQIPGTNWNIISNSYNGQFGIKTDGTLWSWGWNDNGTYGGLLGHNNKTNYSSPRQVGSDTTWDDVVVLGTSDSVIAHKTDGTLWSWGYNGNGQLGHSNKSNYSSPEQINGTTWSGSGYGIAGGSQYTYALKTDGTLWSWGYNSFGGLGQNNRTEYSSPRQVGSDTTWAKVTSRGRSVYAIKTDGTAWAWGNNIHGQLGLNTQGDHRSSPAQIPGTDWDIMDSGSNHGLARQIL